MIIYGLYDPRDGALRYVGQTYQTMPRRLSGHLCTARNHKGPRHVVHWIRSLLVLGLKPQIRLIVTASTPEQLNALEVQVIREALASGARLTNHDTGGRGAPGRPMSPEHRARLHNPEVWSKISATRKGQPSPRKGVVVSDEVRARMKASKQGVVMPLRRPDVSLGQIKYLRGKGMSIRKMAEVLAVSTTTIKDRVRTLKGSA